MPHLLDTDWIVDCLNDRQDALQTVRTLSREGVRTSIITYAELYQGAYYARDPAAALRFLAEFLQGIPILPLSVAVAERFAVVRGALSRQHRQQIGDKLQIAATALDGDLKLVTRNMWDFSLVPRLKIYEADSSNPRDSAPPPRT